MPAVDLADRNYWNDELMARARGFLGDAAIGSDGSSGAASTPGATAFGPPTASQTGGGPRATIASPGSNEGPDMGRQYAGLAKSGLDLGRQVPGDVGSSIRGVGVPGVEGSSAVGAAGGLLGAGLGAYDLAQGDYLKGGVGLASGAGQLAGSLGYQVPYLGTLASLYNLYNAGNAGLDTSAGARAGVHAASAGMATAGGALPALVLEGGLAAKDYLLDPLFGRAADSQRQVERERGAGEIGAQISTGWENVQNPQSLYAKLSEPIKGSTGGDMLADYIRTLNYGGPSGWEDPYMFQNTFGLAPQASYDPVSRLLSDLGYTGTQKGGYDARGIGNIAELLSYGGGQNIGGEQSRPDLPWTAMGPEVGGGGAAPWTAYGKDSRWGGLAEALQPYAQAMGYKSDYTAPTGVQAALDQGALRKSQIDSAAKWIQDYDNEVRQQMAYQSAF